MHWFSVWLTTFGLLLAIIDPFGYVPMYITMTARDTEEHRKRVLVRACVAAFLVLTFFTLFGELFLRFFGISIPALQITGGLILLLTAFEMLRIFQFDNHKLSESEESEASKKDDISIVPLAIPMLSGPGAITTVVVLVSKDPTLPNYLVIISSCLVNLVLTYYIFSQAPKLMKYIGVTGLNALTRVMGLLLGAMAVQLVLNGIISIQQAS